MDCPTLTTNVPNKLYKDTVIVTECEYRPGWVVGEEEGRSVGVVVPLEVPHDHVVHTLQYRLDDGLLSVTITHLCSGRVAAGVGHAAAALLQVVPHHQGQLPDPGVRLHRSVVREFSNSHCISIVTIFDKIVNDHLNTVSSRSLFTL